MGAGNTCSCAEPTHAVSEGGAVASAGGRKQPRSAGSAGASAGTSGGASGGAAVSRTPFGRVACGADATWLLSKGCGVHIRWTAVGGPAGDTRPMLTAGGVPPALLPDVLSIPWRVVQVAAGEDHALFLTGTQEARVFAAGGNAYGQLGLGDALPRKGRGGAWEVVALEPTEFISGVASGGHVSMCVSQRGDVWTWGRNEESGVLCHGPLPVHCVPVPTQVACMHRKVRSVQVATGGWAAFSVSHIGSMYSWGGGLCGAHGHGHQGNEASAKALRALEGTAVVQVAAGALHALALGSHGEVFAWGRVAGAFGREPTLQLVPKLVDALLGVRVVHVGAGGDHSMALTANGEVYAWGASSYGALIGGGTEPGEAGYALVHQLQLPGVPTVMDLACGRCHSAFLAARPGEGAKKPGDVWLCGKAAAPSEHVASQHEGQHRIRDMGGGFAAPLGAPLRLTRVDVACVLEMMG